MPPSGRSRDSNVSHSQPRTDTTQFAAQTTSPSASARKERPRLLRCSRRRALKRDTRRVSKKKKKLLKAATQLATTMRIPLLTHSVVAPLHTLTVSTHTTVYHMFFFFFLPRVTTTKEQEKKKKKKVHSIHYMSSSFFFFLSPDCALDKWQNCLQASGFWTKKNRQQIGTQHNGTIKIGRRQREGA